MTVLLGYDKSAAWGFIMKFSVIIPVYNKAETVGEAVKSVYAQTMDDYEIIIVDDGSEDALQAALSAFQSPKLRLICQENGGVSAARNTGILHAQGEYVCFLDADDLWKPNHLKTVEDLIVTYPKSDIFVTSHELVDFTGSIIHSSQTLKAFKSHFETDDLLGLLNTTSYEVIHTNSVCIKRSLFKQDNIYFETGVRIGEDTDVWYRFGVKHTVAISQKETTVYRREYSTATKNGNYVHDWIFSRRERELMEDSGISDKVKESIICLIDRYKMTGSREYMVVGNRKEAKRMLSEIRSKRGKRYILSRILTFLPYSLCRLVLKK